MAHTVEHVDFGKPLMRPANQLLARVVTLVIWVDILECLAIRGSKDFQSARRSCTCSTISIETEPSKEESGSFAANKFFKADVNDIPFTRVARP